MTTQETNHSITLELSKEEAQILKHIMGSIVFDRLKHQVRMDGYYEDEIASMHCMIDKTFIELSEILGRD